MEEHLKKLLRRLGLFGRARQMAERGHVARRLLQSVPPYPQHRGEAIEPFFIVGSGRCGTTLLRRLLMAGNEVHVPPESWTLHKLIFRFRKYRWIMEWEDLVRWTVNSFAYQGKGAGGTVKQWFDGSSLYPLVSELTDFPDAKRSLAQLIDGIYRYHGRIHEASFTRWGDKYPYNVYFMPPILEVFPKAKFIHMLRDGTDVVSSWLNMEGYDDLKGRALRWKSAVTMFRQFMKEHPCRCLEVRYEDLVRNPTGTIEKVCNFLSLNFFAEMARSAAPKQEMGQVAQLAQHENVFKSVSAKYIGKGHRTLNDKQKARIADLIGDELGACGYPLPR